MTLPREIWLAILGVGAAHDGGSVAIDAHVALRSGTGPGLVANAASLNGRDLNGMRMNGTLLDGMRMHGWTLGGLRLGELELEGTRFRARPAGASRTLVGVELVGSQLELEVEGEAWQLRIDDIDPDPADPTGEVFFYEVSVRGPGSFGWTSLCHDSTGAPTQAIPLAHRWDLETGARIDEPGAVTFACRGAALAKCVEWGYRPWAAAGSRSLADHHQACTRMVRADYCGDGRSHTFDGTPIDVFDRLGRAVQRASTLDAPGWGIEAEWGPDGAVCLGEQLRLAMVADAGLAHEVPPCLAALLEVDGCGDLDAGRGGLVADRYCDRWQDDPQACGVQP
ncbi:ADYC domain-containing protein [Nannocystis punicea]|uniref:ADYC domain-containing protein n=1 Tax=Nannocystis punicea TaxID=2995304 RepID=A0ABY7H7B1_9BACT|nr:ADYC domain-containing protein [Nannocystis poenicansa]WAS94909.1 ADYC domain-containing protein [Nannocystis poenicansa]